MGASVNHIGVVGASHGTGPGAIGVYAYGARLGLSAAALGFAMVQNGAPGHFVVGTSFLTVVAAHPVTRMTIELNAPAPAGGLKIGWFVVRTLAGVFSQEGSASPR